MIRRLQVLLAMLIVPLFALAQSKVNASEIIAKINRGEEVSYKNADITGALDMTKLQNMKLKEQKGKHDGTKEYISTVKSPLTFVNCTFKGDVLAYFNPDNGTYVVNRNNEVYNTNFESEVRFENCTFEKKSAFKYSEFASEVSFAGSKFTEEALFKYSNFRDAVNFNKVRFQTDANFKYVTFPGNVSFANAFLGGEASFKYVKFKEGVSFQKAVFEGIANFKYAKISDSFNIKGASFNGGADFKYTHLNNRQVSLITLLEMNR